MKTTVSIDFYISLKYLVFLLIITGSPSLIWSQENQIPNAIPPSPMAHEMLKVSQSTPHLYSGAVNASIPLYEIDFDGWKLPLYISYQSNGITTNQEATAVGLGWALKATAIVSRTVRRLDDFKFSNGYIYDQKDRLAEFVSMPQQSEIDRIRYYQDQIGMNNIDTEPDIFHYDFFGYSGSFILDKIDSNGNVKVLKLNKDATSVVFNLASMSFSVTTPAGYKGVFNILERSTNFFGNAIDQGRYVTQQADNLSYGSAQIDYLHYKNLGLLRTVSSWYLSHITSPSGKQMNFKYLINEHGQSEHISISRPMIAPLRTHSSGAENVTFSRQVQEHIYLDKIEVDGGISVVFNHEDRKDLQPSYLDFDSEFPIGQKPLLRYSGLHISSTDPMSELSLDISFIQSYFNEFNTKRSIVNGDYQFLRLRLDKVRIGDMNYNFSYELGGNGLPNKSTHAKDAFGYYNGMDENEISLEFLVGKIGGTTANFILDSYYEKEPTEKEVSPEQYYFQPQPQHVHNSFFAKAGMLKEIQYPTGAIKTFEYEDQQMAVEDPNQSQGNLALRYRPQNATSTGLTNVSFAGLRVRSITISDKHEQLSKRSYEYTLANGQSSGKLIKPLVVLNHEFVLSGNSFMFYSINNGLVGLNTTQSQMIGYSNVTETVIGSDQQSYKTVYEFYNQESEIVSIHQIQPHQIYRNGLLSGKQEFKKQQLINHVTYAYETHETPIINAFGYLLKRDGTSFNVLPIKYRLNLENALLLNQRNTDIFPSGVSEQLTTFNYNSLGQMTKMEVNSHGMKQTTQWKRIQDYPNSEQTTNTEGNYAIQDYIMQHNLLDKLVEQITTINDKVTHAMAYKYNIVHDQLVLEEVFEHIGGPSTTFVSANELFNFDTSYASLYKNNKFNLHGKVLEREIKGEKTVSFMYDEKSKYLIASAENTTYQQLKEAFDQTKGSNFDVNIRIHSHLSEALLTTFEYIPEVGLSKVTTPNGIFSRYTYDPYNRLESVLDVQGNLIQSNRYHLRNY